MFREVFEHEQENSGDRYSESEPKMLPYMVTVRDPQLKWRFLKLLDRKGFACVSVGPYPVIFVNMELKRYGVLCHPFRYAYAGDRNYTMGQFIEEVFRPWDEAQKAARKAAKNPPQA